MDRQTTFPKGKGGTMRREGGWVPVDRQTTFPDVMNFPSYQRKISFCGISIVPSRYTYPFSHGRWLGSIHSQALI